MRLVACLVVLLSAGCGAPDRCAGVPCSEGRVCVPFGNDKVACVVPDAGVP
ncbi:MAG: hypothetical protein ACOZQL_14570 [Myxococcota bacterium]